MPRNNGDYPGLPTREQAAVIPRQVYLKRNLDFQTKKASKPALFVGSPAAPDLELFSTIQYAIDNEWIDVMAGETSLENDSVTNAKLANVATATIKGRTTAGTGDPEDLTKAQVQAILSVDDIITLSGVADGATSLGTFTGTILSDNLTIKAALQQIETLLLNINTQTSGSNGISASSATGTVDAVNSVSGGYTVIGQELMSRTVSTIDLNASGAVTVSLTMSAFGGYTPSNTMWQINLREGTNKIAYTLTSNTDSATITFTAANSNDHILEILAQSRLV